MSELDDKVKGLLSYLFGVIGGIIFLFVLKDSSKRVKIHAAQAIVISLGYFLIQTISGIIPVRIPFLGTAINICYLLLIIFGIVKAYKEEDPELPVVNNIAMSLFKKQIEEESIKTAKKAEESEEPVKTAEKVEETEKTKK